MATTMTGRVHAPALAGAGGWINVAQPLELQQLRGRVVVLDFWTFCCINCLRVVEELRHLEQRFGDSVVVIGVHSPKFPHEADHGAVVRAVQRHHIEHPVLDDPDMQTWQRYGVRAWPTLVVIDQEGYVVATAAGEGNGPALEELIARLLGGHEAPVGPAFTPRQPALAGELAFPGKVASDGTARIAVADTGHDRVLVCDLEGRVLQRFDDFHQPQGVRFDGDRLLVCDTVAGALVAVSLADGARSTLADGMHSPWDVIRLPDGSLVVAEAGLHRLLQVPANGGQYTVLAGTRAEGLRDGPALQAHLAQPSGLTLLDDGSIAFADSEVSALRVLQDGGVRTLVGQGLFEWGDDDGDRDTARLQHPLGVAALNGGAIAVADTFNSRLRIWPDGTLQTLHVDTALSEPGGVDVLPDGRLIVADSNNHRVVAVNIDDGSVAEIHVSDEQRTSASEPLDGASGATVALHVSLDLDGEALDHTQGAPVRVNISAEPASLLGSGPRAWAFEQLPDAIDIPLGNAGEGTLTVDVVAATCDDDVCTIRRNTVQHPLVVH